MITVLMHLLLAAVGLVIAVGVPALIATVSWNGGVPRKPLPRTRPAYGGAYA